MANNEFCSECGKELVKMWNPITKTEITKSCSCALQRVENEKQEMLQAGFEKLRQKILTENGIGRKYSGITIGSIKAVKGQEKAYTEAIEFLERFTADKNTKGFGLFGGVGSGKTYIAASLVNHFCNDKIAKLTEYEKEEAFFGRILVFPPARLISCIELLESLKADNSIIKKYKTVKLLVIDDLGASRITEWADERLFEIIDFRYTQELPIIFTTNMTPTELKEKIDKRTIDRLKEMCNFISVTAPSQRK